MFSPEIQSEGWGAQGLGAYWIGINLVMCWRRTTFLMCELTCCQWTAWEPQV